MYEYILESSSEKITLMLPDFAGSEYFFELNRGFVGHFLQMLLNSSGIFRWTVTWLVC